MFKLFKIFSYISSLFPLVIFLLLKQVIPTDWHFNYYAIAIIGTIFLIQIVAAVFVVNFCKKTHKKGSGKYVEKEIVHFVREKSLTTSYLLGNVLSMLSLADVTFDRISDIANIAFVVLLLIFLGFMHYKNNLYTTNPLFDIFGIVVYTIEGSYEVMDEKKIQGYMLVCSAGDTIQAHEYSFYEYEDKILFLGK